MVLVNNQKFACESCIKGHRSSACGHTERPLFEIKRKGRPVSQCEKCRDLRASKKAHNKCACDPVEQAAAHDRALAAAQAAAAGVKLKVPRFKPCPPSLPNGIKDLPLIYGVAIPSTPFVPPKKSSKCGCGKTRKNCKCHATHARVIEEAVDGLSTLAQAAALCCSSKPTENGTLTKHPSSRPNSPVSKRRKQKHIATPIPGPDLPPLLFQDDNSPLPPQVPSFDTMPSMTEMTSLAGSGCTCGLQCACPGCVEHRGSTHASGARHDCGEGCGTCVDHAAEHARNAIPGGLASTVSGDLGTSIIDQFFARAAALPAPPDHRSMGVHLNPRNTDVFDRAFEPVNLPKLECCGGNCACPEGSCRCGQSCDGKCSSHSAPTFVFGARPAAPARSCCAGKAVAPVEVQVAPVVAPVVAVPEVPTPVAPVPAVQSCCAGKAKATSS